MKKNMSGDDLKARFFGGGVMASLGTIAVGVVLWFLSIIDPWWGFCIAIIGTCFSGGFSYALQKLPVPDTHPKENEPTQPDDQPPKS